MMYYIHEKSMRPAQPKQAKPENSMKMTVGQRRPVASNNRAIRMSAGTSMAAERKELRKRSPPSRLAPKESP